MQTNHSEDQLTIAFEQIKEEAEVTSAICSFVTKRSFI